MAMKKKEKFKMQGEALMRRRFSSTWTERRSWDGGLQRLLHLATGREEDINAATQRWWRWSRETGDGVADHYREKRRCCWRWRSIKKGQRKMVKPSIDEDGAVAARRDRGWRWRWSTLMMVVKLNSAVGDDADEKGSRDKRRRWDGDGDGED